MPPNTDVDDLPADTVRILTWRIIFSSLTTFMILFKTKFDFCNDLCLCIQFNKESAKEIEECKLKVFYISPSAQGNSEDEGLKSSTEQSPDSNSVSLVSDLFLSRKICLH